MVRAHEIFSVAGSVLAADDFDAADSDAPLFTSSTPGVPPSMQKRTLLGKEPFLFFLRFAALPVCVQQHIDGSGERTRVAYQQVLQLLP